MLSGLAGASGSQCAQSPASHVAHGTCVLCGAACSHLVSNLSISMLHVGVTGICSCISCIHLEEKLVMVDYYETPTHSAWAGQKNTMVLAPLM